MTKSAYLLTLALLIANTPHSPALSSERSVVVKVVDVKSGQPIADNHVLVMFSKKNDASHDRVIEARTDKNGEVWLSPDLFRDFVSTQIWVDWHARCAKDINTRWHNTALVSSGLVVNDCNAAPLERKAGQITIGVRDETFWERIAH